MVMNTFAYFEYHGLILAHCNTARFLKDEMKKFGWHMVGMDQYETVYAWQYKHFNSMPMLPPAPEHGQ